MMLLSRGFFLFGVSMLLACPGAKTTQTPPKSQPTTSSAPVSQPTSTVTSTSVPATRPTPEPTQPPSAWTWKNPLPQGNTLHASFCSNEEVYSVGEGGTILRSKDNGKNWTIVRTGQEKLWDISGDASALYAVGEKGALLRSSDKGETWQSLKSNTEKTLYGVYIAPSALYAVGQEGTLLRSLDKGETWTLLQQDAASNLWDISGVEGDIYIAGNNGTLLQSSDGETWKKLTLPDEQLTFDNNGQKQSRDFLSLVVPAKGEAYVFGEGTVQHERENGAIPGKNLIVHTKDSGASWEIVNQTPELERLSSLVQDPKGTIMMIFSDGALQALSGDGAPWLELTKQTSLSQVGTWRSGCFTSFGMAMVGWNGAVRATTQSAKMWAFPPKLGADGLNTISARGEEIYIVGNQGGAAYSPDGGESWRPQSISGASYLRAVWVGENGEAYAAADDTIYYTQDHGTTWQKLSSVGNAASGTVTTHASPRNQPVVPKASLSSLLVTKSGALLAGGALQTDAVLYVSKDKGKTWVETRGAQSSSYTGLWEDEKGRIYASAYWIDSGVMRGEIAISTDEGATWQRKTDFPNGLHAISGDKKSVYAVGYKGLVLRSVDQGTSWETLQSGTEEYLRTVWACGEDKAYIAGDKGFLSLTEDAGKTWKPLPAVSKTVLGVAGRSCYAPVVLGEGSSIWVGASE